VEKASKKILRMDHRALSSEQQSEEPAPIVAAEAPHVEPPPQVPESADVVIMGKTHSRCLAAEQFVSAQEVIIVVWLADPLRGNDHEMNN
jgi:hypothetical protein